MLKLYMTLQTLKTLATDRVRDEETGGVAIEYALLAALIALVIAVGALILGTEISDFFSRIGEALSEITPEMGD